MLAVTLNVLELFKGSSIAAAVIIGQDENSPQEFPIVIKNQQTLGVSTFSGNIAVLGKSTVLTYGENGSRLNSYIHGYTKPVMKESAKRILTYDRGGTKLRIDTANKAIAEIQLPFSIITANISSNGSVVVVTSHDRYACEVRVYDNSLAHLLYRYYATEQFSSVAFSNNEQEIAAISIDAIDGLLACNLYRLDITQEIDAAVMTIPDMLPLDVSYTTDHSIKILGNDKLITINTQSGEYQGHPYKGQLEGFTNSEDNGTVFITKNKFNDYVTLTSLEADGVTAVVHNLEETIIDVATDNEYIALLTKTEIIVFDKALKELNRIPTPRSMSKMSLDNGTIYVLGADSLEKHPALK